MERDIQGTIRVCNTHTEKASLVGGRLHESIQSQEASLELEATAFTACTRRGKRLRATTESRGKMEEGR